MNTSLATPVALAAALLALVVIPCHATTRSVDCDKKQTIQAAVNTATSRADTLEIFVTGTCNEVVIIRRDAVTIDGGGAATIVGHVSVFADNVWLKNITITGPGRGVYLNAGNARLWSVALINNEGEGIRASSNSSVWVRDSNIAGNAGTGIAAQASQMRIENSTISNNAPHGIELAFNSQANISGCDIYDNADYGVLLTAGAQANIDGNTIHHNVSGVHGHLSTTLVLHGNVIQHNVASGVSGFFRTTIQISGAQINYNGNEGIALGKGSTLILLHEVTQAIGNTGPDLWCYDAQSYVDDLALLEMSQVTNCSQFGL